MKPVIIVAIIIVVLLILIVAVYMMLPTTTPTPDAIILTPPPPFAPEWIKTTTDALPSGKDAANASINPLYVCYNTDGYRNTLIGKGWTGTDECRTAMNGKPVLSTTTGYLKNDARYTWTKTPINKVTAGEYKTKPQFVCRANIHDGIHIGGTEDGLNVCRIEYGGAEEDVADFEYLSYP